jgi:hypothetical protein
MRKKLFWVVFLLVGAVLAFSAGVLAAPGSNRGNASVRIPDRAREVAPGVFQLGLVVHDGRVVEGYAFVHYREKPGKPTGCNNDGKCQGWEDANCSDCTGSGEEDGSSCYGFLAKGAKWRAFEGYIVNPDNNEDLEPSFITSNLKSDIAKWEGAADFNILGDGSLTDTVLEADLEAPDDQNEVYFGEIDSSGAIAITVVWGIFSGPPWGRELIEWEQVYDQVDFDWSNSGEPGKMDFENIATHELGHSVGLDDLYDDKCAEQTMYGYAAYGETKKQDLEAGDKAGVKALYQ